MKTLKTRHYHNAQYKNKTLLGVSVLNRSASNSTNIMVDSKNPKLLYIAPVFKNAANTIDFLSLEYNIDSSHAYGITGITGHWQGATVSVALKVFEVPYTDTMFMVSTSSLGFARLNSDLHRVTDAMTFQSITLPTNNNVKGSTLYIYDVAIDCDRYVSVSTGTQRAPRIYIFRRSDDVSYGGSYIVTMDFDPSNNTWGNPAIMTNSAIRQSKYGKIFPKNTDYTSIRKNKVAFIHADTNAPDLPFMFTVTQDNTGSGVNAGGDLYALFINSSDSNKLQAALNITNAVKSSNNRCSLTSDSILVIKDKRGYNTNAPDSSDISTFPSNGLLVFNVPFVADCVLHIYQLADNSHMTDLPYQGTEFYIDRSSVMVNTDNMPLLPPETTHKRNWLAGNTSRIIGLKALELDAYTTIVYAMTYNGKLYSCIVSSTYYDREIVPDYSTGDIGFNYFTDDYNEVCTIGNEVYGTTSAANCDYLGFSLELDLNCTVSDFDITFNTQDLNAAQEYAQYITQCHRWYMWHYMYIGTETTKPEFNQTFANIFYTYTNNPNEPATDIDTLCDYIYHTFGDNGLPSVEALAAERKVLAIASGEIKPIVHYLKPDFSANSTKGTVHIAMNVVQDYDITNKPLGEKGIQALIDQCKAYVQSKKQS